MVAQKFKSHKHSFGIVDVNGVYDKNTSKWLKHETSLTQMNVNIVLFINNDVLFELKTEENPDRLTMQVC